MYEIGIDELGAIVVGALIALAAIYAWQQIIQRWDD